MAQMRSIEQYLGLSKLDGFETSKFEESIVRNSHDLSSQPAAIPDSGPFTLKQDPTPPSRPSYLTGIALKGTQGSKNPQPFPIIDGELQLSTFSPTLGFQNWVTFDAFDSWVLDPVLALTASDIGSQDIR